MAADWQWVGEVGEAGGSDGARVATGSGDMFGFGEAGGSDGARVATGSGDMFGFGDDVIVMVGAWVGSGVDDGAGGALLHATTDPQKISHRATVEWRVIERTAAEASIAQLPLTTCPVTSPA